jgi:hypothetical protein
VKLVEVDPFDTEAAQARLALEADRLGTKVVDERLAVRRVPAAPALREQVDVLADAERLDRLRNDLFRVPLPVCGSRVDPIDASLDRPPNRCDRLGVVGGSPAELVLAAQGPAAEPDGGPCEPSFLRTI